MRASGYVCICAQMEQYTTILDLPCYLKATFHTGRLTGGQRNKQRPNVSTNSVVWAYPAANRYTAWLNGARASLTTHSKYTAGSFASKIQYVLTQRAMSPNDLHRVGLGWRWSKPSLWETNGMRGRERQSRTYLFLWKARLFYWETLGFFLTGEGETTSSFPTGAKSCYKDNVPLVPLIKQELIQGWNYSTDCKCLHWNTVHFSTLNRFLVLF